MPQTAIVHIANAGSGTLNWTTSKNVAWLTLSAASGSAPANLTLTANPSAVANGSTVSGQVVISDGGTQSVTIKVSLSKGVVVANPTGYTPKYLYLPFVMR